MKILGNCTDSKTPSARVFGPSQWVLDLHNGQVRLAIGNVGPGITTGYELRMTPAEADKLAQAIAKAAFAATPKQCG